MISNFTILDLVILALLWFFMSAFSNLLWMRYVTMRYVGKAVMNWIDGLDKDEESQKVISKLFLLMFSWAGHAQLKTGRTVKNKDPETGEISESEEILTPVDMLGQKIAAFAFRKINSGVGGTKAALGRIFEEEAASSGGLSPTALKELSKGRFGPALMEMAVPHLQNRLNKNKDNIGPGDGKY